MVGRKAIQVLQTFRSGGDHSGRIKLPLTSAQRKQVAQAAGAGIARVRARAGLTQESVAESLGIGIGIEAVSRLERGVVDASVSRLVELAELFGCGMAELLLPGSSRPTDQAMAIAQEIGGLPPKDHEALVQIVRHLVELLSPKPTKRHADKG